MNRHLKSLIVMLITQGCCVALGLHLHDSYLRASVANGEVAAVSGEQATVGDLIRDAQPAFRLLSVVWILAMQVFVAFLTLSRIYHEMTEEMVALRMKALTRERQVRKTRDALIFGLAALAESRDPETGRHLERISLYASRLATELFRRGMFRDAINRNFLRMIGSSATLHDIGKVSVRDDVLLKPGPLTAEERQHIQTHTIVGGQCIRAVEAQTGDSHFLKMAREIATSHHERWDGTGYPQRIAGKAIPLAARIVAIADVYDALSVRRTYKDALPHEQCVEMIAEGAGSHFDPTLVQTFLCIESDFAEIARHHSPEKGVVGDDHALPIMEDDLEGIDEEMGEEVVPLSLLLSSLQSQSLTRQVESPEQEVKMALEAR